MQSYNHVSGGFALTGIFCSFADVNIFERFDTMAVVWIAAILPDIDHSKSIIGWSSGPLARWLQRTYGHRTITHSIFFYLAIVIIAKAMDNLFHQQFTLPVALSLGSHLIFDMCTVQGIPLMYPFSKRPFVLPANTKLRLSVNDFRSEVIVFLFFCCLNVFSYPLMAAGFWARYNRGFATFDHLAREVKRKPGDYSVTILNVAENDTTNGLLVEQKPAEIVLMRKGKFLRLETEKIKLISFLRQGSQHRIETVNLLQVTVDSLNFHLRESVVKVVVQSAQELYYFDGPILRKGTELSVDYPNSVQFQQLAIDNTETRGQLKQLDLQHQANLAAYRIKLAEQEKYRAELHYNTNRVGETDYEEGKRRVKVKELTEKVAEFKAPEPVSEELYRVNRQLLEHKLKETARLNATLLIWQVQKTQD